MRLDNLKKLPDFPVARILTQNGVKLEITLEGPASATAAQVLQELHDKEALLDMLQLLAHALPKREAAWWACLAAREMDAVTKSVKAAEAWVRQPSVETRRYAREMLDAALNDDDTVFCAMAACFADGTMGPDQYEDYDAPPGAVGAAVYGMILISIYADGSEPEDRAMALLGYAISIAQGGRGKTEPNPEGGALTE